MKKVLCPGEALIDFVSMDVGVAREWLRPSQGSPGVLKFSSGKLKLKATCSNYEYLAF